jgi:CBS domain-containing protein
MRKVTGGLRRVTHVGGRSAVAYSYRSIPEAPMNVLNVCSHPAVTAAPSATLADVASLMCDRNVGMVVITEGAPERQIVSGVVTDRDIVFAQLDHTSDLSRLAARDVMTFDPLVIDEGADIEEAIRSLRTHNVRRAPVVSAGGALVGVVSTDDLIASVTQQLMTVVCALAPARTS